MDKNSLMCNLCFGSGVDVGNHAEDTHCPLCNGTGAINEALRREGVAVRTLVKFADLPIPHELRAFWGWYIERERAK